MVDLISVNVNKSDRVVYRECFNISYKGSNGKHDALVNNHLITRRLTSVITD